MLDPISFIHTNVFVHAFLFEVLYGGVNIEFDGFGFASFPRFTVALSHLSSQNSIIVVVVVVVVVVIVIVIVIVIISGDLLVTFWLFCCRL